MEKLTTPRVDREWLDDYDRFHYFSIATYPRIIEQLTLPYIYFPHSQSNRGHSC